MGLWDIASADNAKILQDRDGGFARPVTLQNPEGQTASLNALCNDIANTIDPETGAVVAARYATVTFSWVGLQKAGLGRPVAITSGRPWRVSFSGADGELKTFMINDVPSDDLGTVTCRLKLLKT
jgi:hypothetical protein